MSILAFLWIIVGVVLLGFYNGLLLLDDKTPEDDPSNKKIQDKWHFVGAAIFVYLAATASMVWGIQYAPLTLSLFWSLFAGIVHIVGLKKHFFFVGTTEITDILLRKVFKKDPTVGSAIVKSLAVIISLIIIYICK